MPYKNPEEEKDYQAAYRAAHREEKRAYQVGYYAAHTETVLATQAASRAAHPEQSRAWQAAYRASHPDKVKAANAAYCAAHREEDRASSVAYRAAHPEIIRLNNAKRRARKRGLPATLTSAEWESIQAAHHYKCAYCGQPPPKGKKLTKDRVIAGTRGGGYTKENIVPACGPCNSRKYTNPPAKPVKLVLI